MQQRHQRGLLAIQRRRQHDNSARIARREDEAACRSLDLGHGLDEGTQAADLDPQAGAVCVVGMAGAKGLCNQVLAWHVVWPRPRQCVGQGEQDGSPRQRLPLGTRAHASAAGIQYQSIGSKQCLHLLQTQRLLGAIHKLACSRTLQDRVRFGDFSQQRGHACTVGRHLRVCQRRPCWARVQRAHRKLSLGQRGDGGERCRHAVRVEQGQCSSGLVQAAKQQQLACGNQPGVQRIGMIGARVQCGSRGGQDPRRATEVAHGQRHLGLSHHTSGALHFFMRPKASRGAAQQLACTQMLAQLGHGNAAQGQGRRVVTQGHPLEGAERITGCKCAGGGGNQGVHSA